MATPTKETETPEYDPAVTALFDVVKVRPEKYNAVAKKGGDIIATGKTKEAARAAGYAKVKPKEAKKDTTPAS